MVLNRPEVASPLPDSATRGEPRQGAHGQGLAELMGMDQAEFSRRFKGSPVKRTKRPGLLRNVAAAPRSVTPRVERTWRGQGTSHAQQKRGR